MMPWRILGVPSSAGGRRTGQEHAPAALRRAGLVDGLKAAGIIAEDGGDLEEVRYSQDLQHPRQQNVPLVRRVAGAVAEAVAQACAAETRPLVLGGDCTITLGVVSGLVGRFPDLGVLYFDGDADLKTPADTTSGILDGMGLAHLLGTGVEELSTLGPRYPLLGPDSVVLFGLNPRAGWMGAIERERLDRSSMLQYGADEVRGRVREAAEAALAALEARAEHLLLHFDVDVIDFDDFPAAEVPHREGLTFDEAFEALAVFLASRQLAGLVITEFNADQDTDGMLARRLVNGTVYALERALRSRP